MWQFGAIVLRAVVTVAGAEPGDGRGERLADRGGPDTEPHLGFRAVDDEWLRELVEHLAELANGEVDDTNQPENERGATLILMGDPRSAEIVLMISRVV